MKFLKEMTIVVEGNPVPWSAPDIGNVTSRSGKRHRFAKKNPALIAWQHKVKQAAMSAYGPYEPDTGPIYLDMTFTLLSDEDKLAGTLVIPSLVWEENQDRWKKMGGLPDRTNLIKAVEDGMEGTVFVNDTQVRAGNDTCIWGKYPMAVIRVCFVDPVNPFGA